MHEHSTRRDTGTAKPARPSRGERAHDPSVAGNRAMAELLAPRPVQRWPDLGDLGGMLGGGSSMGDPTADLGGYMPSMPSLPSMPDLGSLVPSMPSLNIPGVNLNIDTDAGTASGGIDFHDGTSGKASYGAGGFDASGQTGSSSASAHVSGANDWSAQAGTTTPGGTSIAGSLGDHQGRFGGGVSAAGANGDHGLLGGAFGGGGPTSGFGSYAGQYGNLDLGF